MRVVLADGTSIDLGATEATPTIGITDYSRRVTDDFGVTTVVERGFSRRMSVKLGVPFAQVDALQRRLADLRATAALWVADDRFASLTMRGFYKDFDLDLAVPPLSYCTLTVEGLAETTAVADPGGDPAPDGANSTLRLLQPVIMTSSVLLASNVAEIDAPEWQAATTYPLGAVVMKASAHRLYESTVAANVGNDPAGISGKWLDIGPTNRWAMFDQALGTATSATDAIVVTLDAGTTGAVALLDVSAVTVRVQSNGYDRTVPAGAGAITFLDLPANTGQVTVTIAGSGTVSVGTLLIGSVVSLGITEASPTAGITDFSKKVFDDFGEVAIVGRAWAKRMSAKALIRTDAIDRVANRIAAVRARPSLWIGKAGLDSLTVYGFFKDFSIEVGKTVSKLSLSIEGLSAAAKIEPVKVGIDWPDVGDPDGTKPSDNADKTSDNTAKDTLAVANRPAAQVINDLDVSLGSLLTEMLRNATYRGETDKILTLPDGTTLREVTQVLSALVDGVAAYVADQRSVDSQGRVKAVTLLSSGGHQIGTVATNDGKIGAIYTIADEWGLIDPADADDPNAVATKPLYYVNKKLYMDQVYVRLLDVDVVNAKNIVGSAVQQTRYVIMQNDVTVARGANQTVASITFNKHESDSALKIQFYGMFWSADDLQFSNTIVVDNAVAYPAGTVNMVFDQQNSAGRQTITPFLYLEGLAAGRHTIEFQVYNGETDNIVLTVTVGVNAAGATGTTIALTIAAAAVSTFRQATTGTTDPDGLNALAAGITKRRWRNPMPLFIGAGQTGRCRITAGGYYIDKSVDGLRPERIISWSGVTALGMQVHCVNSAGAVVGNIYRAKRNGVESFVPDPGDIVFDPFLPSDLGLIEWPDSGQIMGMMEVDAAAGTLLPMTYVSGSVGDSGAGSYDGGTTSFGALTLAANGGSSAGARIYQFLKCEIEHTLGAMYGQGTSRVDGKGNAPAGYGLIRGGFMQQAAYKAKKPMMKIATDGDRIEYWATNIKAGQTWRLNHVAGFTDVYLDEPYNDINTRPLADILVDLDYVIGKIKQVNPTCRIHLGESTVRSTSASGNFLAPPDQTPNANYRNVGSGIGYFYNLAIRGRAGVATTYNCRPDIYYSADYPDDWYSDGVTNKLMTPEGDHFTAFGEARVGAAGGVMTTHIAANVKPNP